MNKKICIFGVGFFTFCLPICTSSSLLAAGVNGSGIPGSAEMIRLQEQWQPMNASKAKQQGRKRFNEN